MSKRFAICIPMMIREEKPGDTELTTTDGMEQTGLWIGIHAKDEDDALNQLARLIAGGGVDWNGERREDG